MSSRSRATIRDVAQKAGVSHQTVSRVINGHERVTEGTRKRVEAAIAELGYQPNAIARSMARGRTTTLACISPNLTDFTYASFIEGAEMEARKRGYFLLAASAPDADTFATLINQLLASRRSEGLLVITPNIEPQHKRLPRYVSAVFIGANPKLDWISSVTMDDERAGRMAADHLIQLNHSQIALITGPMDEESSQGRLHGFQSALEAGSITIQPQLIKEGDWSATSGYQAVQHSLEQAVPFSAIFAHNDRMAVGAIRALRDAGKRVPQDVSVIGIDDMPLASYFDPPLTTILQDTFRMGREAACQLISSIEEPENPCRQLRIEPTLIIRQSTAHH